MHFFSAIKWIVYQLLSLKKKFPSISSLVHPPLSAGLDEKSPCSPLPSLPPLSSELVSSFQGFQMEYFFLQLIIFLLFPSCLCMQKNIFLYFDNLKKFKETLFPSFFSRTRSDWGFTQAMRSFQDVRQNRVNNGRNY